ncbi:MAG TPA: hypothetical protein DCY13_15930, partial [Verrucomicrobiales bacterium]|nr:hypothetical protein [Verrucomicrobiales bacterium]
DGGSARVMGAAVGPYDLDSVKIGRWERIVARLPKPIREMVGWTTGGRSWGGSRSWFHVPNETNALQIYLRLDHSTLVASGSVANLKARIVDADGWVWESHGRGDRTVNPGASNRLDLIGLSFAGFPRWQSEFEVKLMLDGWSSGGRVLEEIAKFNLKNPVPATPTNLAARPLPQEIQAGPVQVVLNRLDYRPGWRSPEEVSAAEGERLGGLNPVFTSYERTGGGIVSNAWHEVMKDLEDNYGNNSHGALPVRRPGDTNAPPIQWRGGLHLVGD